CGPPRLPRRQTTPLRCCDRRATACHRRAHCRRLCHPSGRRLKSVPAGPRAPSVRNARAPHLSRRGAPRPPSGRGRTCSPLPSVQPASAGRRRVVGPSGIRPRRGSLRFRAGPWKRSGDTSTRRRRGAKARRPVRHDLIAALGAADLGIKVGAVCVYHAFVSAAVKALEGSGIPVAAVSTGFPAGLNPLPQRVEEIRASVAAGAREIDVVITRAYALTGDWEALYDEIRAFRAACGQAHMKVVVGTGDLARLGHVARASQVAMMAGADFSKTSPGKEPVNATLPVGVVMTRQIRDYAERTGHAVGFKPAGGIRKAKQALDWLILMKEELGDRWLRNDLFRLGASALL